MAGVSLRGAISTFRQQINISLFRGFLLLGIISGIFLSSLNVSAESSATALKQQKNYLIAIVEDTNKDETGLLALWLAASSPEYEEINWMPIFPKIVSSDVGHSAESNNNISVNPQVLSDWKKMTVLREAAFRWDEIIVLEPNSLSQLMQLLPNQSDGAPIPIWMNNQSSLYEQVLLIQNICDYSNHFNDPQALNQILSLMDGSGNIRSTLNSFEIIALWDNLKSKQFTFACNHPWAD